MLSFSVYAIKAYSGEFIEDSQWRSWAMDEFRPLARQNNFKPRNIPMMQARRMGLADKMAIELALEFYHQYPDIDSIVFASRHGQLMRTHKLLEHFFKTSEMSPTDFATAVHNSAAGQFSIMSKLHAPISSVASEDQTFCAGLLEAILMLQEKTGNVLFVMFDGKVPEFYQTSLKQSEFCEPYALAMLLTQGKEWNLSCPPRTVNEKLFCPDGLAFLKYYYQNKSNFVLTSETQQWQFVRY